VVNLN